VPVKRVKYVTHVISLVVPVACESKFQTTSRPSRSSVASTSSVSLKNFMSTMVDSCVFNSCRAAVMISITRTELPFSVQRQCPNKEITCLTLNYVAHKLCIDSDDVAALIYIGFGLGEQCDGHDFERFLRQGEARVLECVARNGHAELCDDCVTLMPRWNVSAAYLICLSWLRC